MNWHSRVVWVALLLSYRPSTLYYEYLRATLQAPLEGTVSPDWVHKACTTPTETGTCRNLELSQKEKDNERRPTSDWSQAYQAYTSGYWYKCSLLSDAHSLKSPEDFLSYTQSLYIWIYFSSYLPHPDALPLSSYSTDILSLTLIITKPLHDTSSIDRYTNVHKISTLSESTILKKTSRVELSPCKVFSQIQYEYQQEGRKRSERDRPLNPRNLPFLTHTRWPRPTDFPTYLMKALPRGQKQCRANQGSSALYHLELNHRDLTNTRPVCFDSSTNTHPH